MAGAPWDGYVLKDAQVAFGSPFLPYLSLLMKHLLSTLKGVILNALQVIQCIDESRCEEVGYWLPEDERPDKVGQYRKVVGLKVDPARVGAAHIFRPWGWLVVLIVSERVKLAMEAEGITGTDFVEV